MSLKVLIVEDDKDLAELIAYNLKKEGYETLLSYRGALAIELLMSQTP